MFAPLELLVRKGRAGLVACILLAVQPAGAADQGVVVYPPGNGSDVVARAVAEALRQSAPKKDWRVESVGTAASSDESAFNDALNGPRDGSRVYIFRGSAPGPGEKKMKRDYGKLTPIALLFDISDESAWIGVFLPPGAPPNNAERLEPYVMGTVMTRRSLTKPGEFERVLVSRGGRRAFETLIMSRYPR